MNVVTRFAPSPTGYLHVGGLRTALYNYFFAKKNGGKMFLRVEDTDRERFVPGAVEALIHALDHVGIRYDEGPFLKDGKVVQVGSHGPYVQSERLSLYREHAEKLIKAGHAYYCFCSRERLDELRKRQTAAKQQPKYDRLCLGLLPEEVSRRVAEGESHVVRMKIPSGKTAFVDLVRDRVEFSHEEIDDQVLLKSDGFPTYHLAVVVDDHHMGITHVLRADEWLTSTPKHLLLYGMFGWTPPVFAHLPLILNPDHSKLSKRQGDVAVEDYLAKGYLVEALVNFVALLGFNPKADQEIYTLDELASLFELGSVNKGGAVFDLTKLNWMNGEYIRKTEDGRLAELARPFFEKAGVSTEGLALNKIIAIEKQRLTTLAELPDRVRSYKESQAYEPSLLIWKKSNQDETLERLRETRELLSSLPEERYTDARLLEDSVKEYIEGKGLTNGPVLWPMRVALSGKDASPSPFELAWALGKEETVRRLDAAIKSLQA